MPAALTRRLMVGAMIALGAGHAASARTPAPRSLAVYKTPTCPCCDGWIAHMRQAGFVATVTILNDLRPLRLNRGLPDALASCWQEALNTDSHHYGGSDVGNTGAVLQCQAVAADGHARSLAVTLPPLSTVFLVPSP